MSNSAARVLLGIDIGTTKVAAALVNGATREVVATASLAHESDTTKTPIGRSEQKVLSILSTLDACIAELPVHTRGHVIGIGMTGQMHGIALWNPATAEFSNLVTWQDQRCVEHGFIEKLRTQTGEHRLQTGYGGASLAWFVEHEPSLVKGYARAGTIHDLIAALVTGSEEVCTDPSDAASWGFFDISRGMWNTVGARKAHIRPEMLPSVRPAGTRLGGLSAEYARRWGIPEGIPVGVPLGDNQASLFGSLTDPTRQIALTIGTGAQLSVVVPSLPEALPTESERFEFRPYIGDTFIAVAASLSGGRVLATLGRALHDFIGQLGVAPVPSLHEIQSAMHEQGMHVIDTAVRANPSFSGERFDPSLRGSFTNLSFDTFTIGDITAALCRGLVEGLRDSLPSGYLAGRTEVVGSGNAIQRSPLMQRTIEQAFSCKLVLSDGAETTACGAALLAGARLP